jgi:internalin A
MSRYFLPLIVWLLLGGVGCKPGGKGDAQEQAIAAIEKAGGQIKREGDNPNDPVVTITLDRTKKTDACLKQVKHFTKLKQLQISQTEVSETGLENLAALAHLERLMLYEVPITDADLRYVKPLTTLKQLTIGHTKITDAGLENLKVFCPSRNWNSPFQDS